MQQPGWYYAQGDPAGTQRYWDGELWIGDPQFVPAPQPPGSHDPGYLYPESSQATAALVLSILSIFICTLLAPVGWSMGVKELDAIDLGLRDPTNRGTAQAARIIGMIMTFLMIIAIVLIIIFFAFAISSHTPR